MLKLFLVACLSLCAAPIFSAHAQDDNSEDLTQDEPQLELAQWGRTWTCFARSRNGRTFSGRSPNANSARRIAMSNCRSWSRSNCWSAGCR